MEYLFAVLKIHKGNALFLFVKLCRNIFHAKQEGIAVNIGFFSDYDILLDAASGE